MISQSRTREENILNRVWKTLEIVQALKVIILPRECMSRWQGLMTPSSITPPHHIHNTAHFQLHFHIRSPSCLVKMPHYDNVASTRGKE